MNRVLSRVYRTNGFWLDNSSGLVTGPSNCWSLSKSQPESAARPGPNCRSQTGKQFTFPFLERLDSITLPKFSNQSSSVNQVLCYIVYNLIKLDTAISLERARRIQRVDRNKGWWLSVSLCHSLSSWWSTSKNFPKPFWHFISCCNINC